MRGNFIEDMEEIQLLYQSRLVHYSSEYYFNGNEKAKGKMLNYKNCVEKMKKVMTYINNL